MLNFHLALPIVHAYILYIFFFVYILYIVQLYILVFIESCLGPYFCSWEEGKNCIEFCILYSRRGGTHCTLHDAHCKNRSPKILRWKNGHLQILFLKKLLKKIFLKKVLASFWYFLKKVIIVKRWNKEEHLKYFSSNADFCQRKPI